MAATSAKTIKSRIRSLDSTQQITRAMELVAAAKLRKTQLQLLQSRPYVQCLYDTICSIANRQASASSLFFDAQEGETAYIVVAGDRGLSGGYNNRILKQITDQQVPVLPIGRSAMEHFRKRGFSIIDDRCLSVEKITANDCFLTAENLCNAYLEGKFGRIILYFTTYVSPLTQTPTRLQLLPIERQRTRDVRTDMLYEPSREAVLNAIIPEYIGGVLYGALCESRAAEHAARRSAMDSATQNAGEMIDALRSRLNHTRQAAITQEITEIVAGT